MVKCCHSPTKSMNLRSTITALRSLASPRTSFAFMRPPGGIHCKRVLADKAPDRCKMEWHSDLRPEALLSVPLIETGAAPAYAGPCRAAMAEPLSDRARDVLHAIIREYISTGGPVGSQQLARTSGFEVSSATLRNVM